MPHCFFLVQVLLWVHITDTWSRGCSLSVRVVRSRCALQGLQQSRLWPKKWQSQFLSLAAGFTKSSGWVEFCFFDTCSTHCINGLTEKLRTKKSLWASFCSDRPEVLQNATFFPIFSVKPKPPVLAQTFSFVQSERPLTWGLSAQFVSPWQMNHGWKHNHLYKWCYSRVSFLFLLSGRKRILASLPTKSYRGSVYN